MKDFCEALLSARVSTDVEDVYKRAIETENYPNGLREHWNGVYAYVDIMQESNKESTLMIQLLSHNLSSLKQVVEWYERVGCTVVRTDYKEAKV
ncbi:hypothetical protein [Enterococcus dispar]